MNDTQEAAPALGTTTLSGPEERLARLRLASVPGVRADRLLALMDAVGGAAEALRQDAPALAATGCVALDTAERLLLTARAFDAEGALREAERAGVRVLLLDDADVPDLLRSIPDPPILLYCLGTLSPASALAVVGSRRPTAYGARMARRFAREAAEAGLSVVSGLARGVDSEVHRAVLEAGGVTWAVLGSGLLRIYPGENAPLARRIAETGGAALSEFPLHAAPVPENFPRRNRVLSGLSSAVVVIEGTETSGALITARLALEQGREVFAVPGPADSPLSRGPHRLIKEGAALACSLDDVREALPQLFPASSAAKGSGSLAAAATDEERAILERLREEPRTLEELSSGLRREAHILARTLLDLEMRGLVTPLGAQRYALK